VSTKAGELQSCELDQVTEWNAREWQSFQKNTDPVTGKWIGADRTFGAFYLRRRLAVALAMNAAIEEPTPSTATLPANATPLPEYDAFAKCENLSEGIQPVS